MNQKEVDTKTVIILLASLFIIPLSFLYLTKGIFHINDRISYFGTVGLFFIIIGVIIAMVMEVEDERIKGD